MPPISHLFRDHPARERPGRLPHYRRDCRKLQKTLMESRGAIYSPATNMMLWRMSRAPRRSLASLLSRSAENGGSPTKRMDSNDGDRNESMRYVRNSLLKTNCPQPWHYD